MSLKNTSYFNPTSISNCSLWLDGKDTSSTSMSLTGNTVNTWKDKSGNGYNYTQSSYSTSLPPLSNIATGTGVYFGSQQGLYNTTFPFPTSYTIFAIANQTTNSGSYQYILHAPYNADYVIFFGSLNGNFATFAGSSGWNDVNANSPNSSSATTSVLCCTNNGTTLTPYFNTVAMTTKTGTNVAATGITLGDTDTAHPRQPWLGTVGELIIFNLVLSTTQRQQIEGYLAWKWGLTSSLPSSHPYALVPSYGVPSLVPNAPAKTSLTYANHPVIAAGGCALWLDASDSSTISYSSGSNLSQWRDKSGNGYTMVNSTGTTTVASAALNSYNAIYTPSGTSAKIASFTGRTKFTLFFVGKCAVGRYLLGFNSGFIYAGNDTLMSFTLSGNTFDCVDSIGLTNSVVSANTWFIFSIGYDNVAAFTPNPYNINGSPLNGANRTTITSPYVVPNGVPDQYTSNPFYINSLGTNSYDSDYTSEIIFYNTNLNVSQRQNIEGYLAQKWGLTANLPVGHPYKSSFPLYPSPITTGVRAMAGKRWSPLVTGGCQLWLDATDSSTLTLSGSNVTQWRDKSGNAANATASGNGLFYTQSAINSNYAVLLPGNSPYVYFTGANTSGTIYNAVFIVATTISGITQYARLFSFGGSSDYNSIGNMVIDWNSPGGIIIERNQIITPSTNPLVYSTPFITSTVISGTSALGYINGSNTLTGTTTSTNFTYSQYELGSYTGFSAYSWFGYVGEVIVYNSLISDPQRQQVEGYLAWKWGLKASLPSSHPYKLFPPSP
jgi:hypothetical protein